MNPNVCDFGEILERFHEDFHRSDQSITEDEDAESFSVYEELIANYTPHLTMTQWIKVLGELVVGLYINPAVVATKYQSTTPFAITA
jgi:hypothetical protein